MAFSVSELTTTAIVLIPDADETAEKDVRAGGVTAYGMYVDNSANAAASYVKLYDNADPTVGTDAPEYIFEIEGSGGLNGGKVFIPFNGGTGLVFGTALSVACVTAGGTSGVTGPTSTVPMHLVTS